MSETLLCNRKTLPSCVKEARRARCKVTWWWRTHRTITMYLDALRRFVWDANLPSLNKISRWPRDKRKLYICSALKTKRKQALGHACWIIPITISPVVFVTTADVFHNMRQIYQTRASTRDRDAILDCAVFTRIENCYARQLPSNTGMIRDFRWRKRKSAPPPPAV